MIVNHTINPYYIHNISDAGYKNIRLTLHSIQRGFSRLFVDSKTLRKMASSAKRKGINITNIDDDTDLLKFGISNNDKRALIRFMETTSIFNTAGINSKRFYLYKGVIWVFCGHKANTLKTVFELHDEYFTDDFSINKKYNMLKKALGDKYNRYTTDDIQDLFDCISNDGEEE